MRGGPQISPSVSCHGNIGITCYIASYYRNELSALQILWELCEYASQISLLFWVVYSPSQLVYSPTQLVWPEFTMVSQPIRLILVDWFVFHISFFFFLGCLPFF
jgi:hypothetical protein